MIIASVQHTGTRFLRSLLKLDNVHFGQKYLHKLDGEFVITPLRELDKIMSSWVKRDMDLERLHFSIGQMINYPVDFYFPIDAKDREAYLARLNELLGTDHKTDWPIVTDGQCGLHEPKHPEYAELIRIDYSEWFDQFYGRNSRGRRSTP